MEELLQLVTKFNEDTWLDFYDAVRRFYEYIDEDLLSSVPFTEEQLKDCSKSNLEDIIKILTKVAKDRLHRREAITSKRVISYLDDSFDRCDWLRRRDTTSEPYLIMSHFIDEDKLRDLIVRNPHKGWNPLQLINWINGWAIPCIFMPSKKLRDRYDFIIINRNPNGRIASVDIDVARLLSYDTIYINEQDIVSFFYWLYHPYIWWIVQSWQRKQLICG